MKTERVNDYTDEDCRQHHGIDKSTEECPNFKPKLAFLICKFLRKIFKKPTKQDIIDEYKHVAEVVGDMESYIYMGEPIGYRNWRNNLAIMTRKLRSIGYIPFTKNERFLYGGYGEKIELRKRD